MWHLLQLYKHIPVSMCIVTRNVKCVFLLWRHLLCTLESITHFSANINCPFPDLRVQAHPCSASCTLPHVHSWSVRSCDLLLPLKSSAPLWGQYAQALHHCVDNSCPQATSRGYEGDEHSPAGLKPVVG